MVFNKSTNITLHNFFVFYPLEVVILDKKKKVIEVKHNFLPFTLWSGAQEGHYLLELGEERSKGKIKLGDSITLL